MKSNFFRILSVALILSASHFCHAQSFGNYVGNVKAEWLDDGRTMKLLAPLKYIDPARRIWLAPTGWIVDGASIPQFAWSGIGGPFEGKYRYASVIHDVACDEKVRPWELVHETFYYAMRASGVEDWRAKVMYAAVFYFGPRWSREVIIRGLPIEQTPVAMDEALKRAEPGSTAEVREITPWGPEIEGAERLATFRIIVAPPEPELTKEGFNELREKITSGLVPGSSRSRLSLSDIRKHGQ